MEGYPLGAGGVSRIATNARRETRRYFPPHQISYKGLHFLLDERSTPPILSLPMPVNFHMTPAGDQVNKEIEFTVQVSQRTDAATGLIYFNAYLRNGGNAVSFRSPQVDGTNAHERRTLLHQFCTALGQVISRQVFPEDTLRWKRDEATNAIISDGYPGDDAP